MTRTLIAFLVQSKAMFLFFRQNTFTNNLKTYKSFTYLMNMEEHITKITHQK